MIAGVPTANSVDAWIQAYTTMTDRGPHPERDEIPLTSLRVKRSQADDVYTTNRQFFPPPLRNFLPILHAGRLRSVNTALYQMWPKILC